MALKVISRKEAERYLAALYADRRAAARKAATLDECVHMMPTAWCSLCMGEDPFTPVVNVNTGETEMLPTNEIVATRHSPRGYENTSKPIVHDNDTWKLQHQQRNAR